MVTTRILYFLLPVGVFLLWLLARTATGRRPTRFTANVALSLLLILYLAGVAGTGIFWVASQELPVFDWHYLLGYIFLTLAITHLVLNWRSVAAFLRRRASDDSKDPAAPTFLRRASD